MKITEYFLSQASKHVGGYVLAKPDAKKPHRVWGCIYLQFPPFGGWHFSVQSVRLDANNKKGIRMVVGTNDAVSVIYA
jgi:hypothetical protein